jgi:hypothetical protein
MAVTIYQPNEVNAYFEPIGYRVHFEDNTSVLVNLMRDARGLIAPTGKQFIILDNAILQFGKQITEVTEEPV